MTAPEKMTPKEHESAMSESLEALVPLMAGATYFGPSALCVSDRGGESLTEAGREFAGVIYHLSVDAHRAASDAVRYLNYTGDVYKKAERVEGRLALCLLFSRALMDPDLPSSLSANEALIRIRKQAGKAYVTITGRTLHALVGDITDGC